jgi:aspartate kinase
MKDEARVTVIGVPDVPGSSLEIFSRIADRNIAVDMIVQNVGSHGRADVSFTVARNELRSTLEAVHAAKDALQAEGITHDEDVSKVSVVGLGMARQVGVADRMFRALSKDNINIQMITTSEIKISVLVRRDQAQDALRAAHRAFELDKEPALTAASGSAPTSSRSVPLDQYAVDVVQHLQGADMEELSIGDISLDDGQASVTIVGVPDTPGIAAKVFEDVAAHRIFVDMIVQSYAPGERANLSFTVPRDKLADTLTVAQELAASFGCQDVTSAPSIAKLSVSGIGLRSHTSVAIRMFRALSQAKINIAMISTSEVRVNVVVDGAEGQPAHESLVSAFADVMR